MSVPHYVFNNTARFSKTKTVKWQEGISRSAPFEKGGKKSKALYSKKEVLFYVGVRFTIPNITMHIILSSTSLRTDNKKQERQIITQYYKYVMRWKTDMNTTRLTQSDVKFYTLEHSKGIHLLNKINTKLQTGEHNKLVSPLNTQIQRNQSHRMSPYESNKAPP